MDVKALEAEKSYRTLPGSAPEMALPNPSTQNNLNLTDTDTELGLAWISTIADQLDTPNSRAIGKVASSISAASNLLKFRAAYQEDLARGDKLLTGTLKTTGAVVTEALFYAGAGAGAVVLSGASIPVAVAAGAAGAAALTLDYFGVTPGLTKMLADGSYAVSDFVIDQFQYATSRQFVTDLGNVSRYGLQLAKSGLHSAWQGTKAAAEGTYSAVGSAASWVKSFFF